MAATLRRWVVALSSAAVVACGPAVTGGVSAWRERDRLAEWSGRWTALTAEWMPFLPPAAPAGDPRAKALVEALTAELGTRTALAAERGEGGAEGGAEGDLALTIGRDGAWTLEALPAELGWEGFGGPEGTSVLFGNRAPLLPAPPLPLGPGALVPLPGVTGVTAGGARPGAPLTVNGKAPAVVIRPGGPPAITLDEITRNAKQYLGVPYVWGGNSAAGLDCSAYVSKAWGVGRYTTDSIGAVSFKIGKDDLLPGDILNLTTREDPRGYGHVRLFAGWANAERTRVWVYEETPPKALFHAITYDNAYTPMRRVNYVPDGSAAEALEAALAAGAAAAPKGASGAGPGPVGPGPARERAKTASNPVGQAVESVSKALGGVLALPGLGSGTAGASSSLGGNGNGRRQQSTPRPTQPPAPTSTPRATRTPITVRSSSADVLGAAATGAPELEPSTGASAASPTQRPPTRTSQPAPTATAVPPTATRRAQTRQQIVVPTAPPVQPTARPAQAPAQPSRTAQPRATTAAIVEPTIAPVQPTRTARPQNTVPPPPPTVQPAIEPTARPPRATATTAVPPTQAPARATRVPVEPTTAPPPPPPPTAQPTVRTVPPTATRAPATQATQAPQAPQPTVRPAQPAAQPTTRPSQPAPQPTARPANGNGSGGTNGNAAGNGNANGRNRR